MSNAACTDDVSCGPDAAPSTSTGVAVLDKLAALEVARKIDREKRREEVRSQADPLESVKTFLAQFADAVQSIQAQLAEAEAMGPQQDASGRAAVQVKLDAAAAALLVLEGRCASAAYFLPTFEQKQCAATIAETRDRVTAAASQLLPKRKFAFSGKVARVKAVAAVTAAEAGGCDAGSYTPLPSSHPQADQATSTSGRSDGTDGTPGRLHAAAAASGGSGAPACTVAVPSERDVALAQSGRGLMGLRGQTVVVTADELRGDDYVLLDLADCDVYLLGHMSALRVLGLRTCRVYCGPVTGACFIDDVLSCTLMVAAYQVRIHRTHATDMYLRVRSKPIIEHSTGVRFAPYGLAHPGVEALMAGLKLGEETGLYSQVDDFGWIKATQSPNWSILPEGERLAAVTAPAGSAANTSPAGTGHR